MAGKMYGEVGTWMRGMRPGHTVTIHQDRLIGIN